MISGGWDNTIVVYDVRRPYPAFSMLGPHVCGESLDINGTTILAGSYSQDENLTLWDMRM
jgi:COMPASS component SWD3